MSFVFEQQGQYMLHRIFRAILFFSLLFIYADIEQPASAQDNILKIEWEQVSAGEHTGITWSPDGNSIAFGNANGTQVLIFDLKSQKIKTEVKLSLPATSLYSPLVLEWSPDGTHIAVARNRTFYLINMLHEPLAQSNPNIAATDMQWITPSLVSVFDSSGFIHLLDIPTNTVIRSIDLGSHGEIIYPAFDWNSNTGLFAAPLYTSSIGFWTISGDTAKTLVRPEPSLSNVLRSDCLTSANLTSGANREIISMRWAKDGQSLAIAIEYRSIVCNLNHILTTITVNTLPQLLEPDFDPTRTGAGLRAPRLVTWSPDGHWLMSSSSVAGDCWVAVFDVLQDYELRRIIEGEVCFEAWRWSPDGKYLAVSGYKGVWIGTVQSE